MANIKLDTIEHVYNKIMEVIYQAEMYQQSMLTPMKDGSSRSELLLVTAVVNSKTDFIVRFVDRTIYARFALAEASDDGFRIHGKYQFSVQQPLSKKWEEPFLEWCFDARADTYGIEPIKTLYGERHHQVQLQRMHLDFLVKKMLDALPPVQ